MVISRETRNKSENILLNATSLTKHLTWNHAGLDPDLRRQASKGYVIDTLSLNKLQFSDWWGCHDATAQLSLSPSTIQLHTSASQRTKLYLGRVAPETERLCPLKRNALPDTPFQPECGPTMWAVWNFTSLCKQWMGELDFFFQTTLCRDRRDFTTAVTCSQQTPLPTGEWTSQAG
jgi:hypothetical protein